MEYFDYYLYGLASATVFPAVFFSADDPFVAQLSSFATFAVGFFLRPVGGIVFGYIGDRMGRKITLLITVIGMGLTTAAIGLIPPDYQIGVAAPILLLILRMFQGLFVGGEMGGAATMVVEHAPIGKKGLYGAFLISGAGIANVMSAGAMAALGLGPESFFMTIGWRIPFVFALVLAIVAIILRRHLGESEEFTAHSKAVAENKIKRTSPLVEVFRHPKNAILGILIGLPQSIAGSIILTFGLSFMVRGGTNPTIGFVIPGVAMQATLQTMLTEMFDVEQRTTGVNIGYQLSNTLGGGLAPLIATALVGWASGQIWPVVVYVAVICLVGAIATATASIRPDTADAGRLHELNEGATA